MLLLKVIVGYFSTSKKFGLRRSLSRSGSLVSMLAVLMVNSTALAAGLATSTVIEPDRSLKRPVTRLIRCLMVKRASEWALSTT